MPINHSSQFSDMTDEQYTLIGKIIVEFSNLDFLLGQLLCRLLITPEFLGRTYTDNMYVSKRISAIENALEIHDFRYSNKIVSEVSANDIKSLLRSANNIQKLRNKFSHYCWSRWDDNKIFGTKLSGKVPNIHNPNHDSITIANSELKKEYKKVYELVDAFQLLIDKIPELQEDKDLIKALFKKDIEEN